MSVVSPRSHRQGVRGSRLFNGPPRAHHGCGPSGTAVRSNDESERLAPPDGYRHGKGHTAEDVLAIQRELLRSEGINPTWPGFSTLPPASQSYSTSWAGDVRVWRGGHGWRAARDLASVGTHAVLSEPYALAVPSIDFTIAFAEPGGSKHAKWRGPNGEVSAVPPQIGPALVRAICEQLRAYRRRLVLQLRCRR